MDLCFLFILGCNIIDILHMFGDESICIFSHNLQYSYHVQVYLIYFAVIDPIDIRV